MDQKLFQNHRDLQLKHCNHWWYDEQAVVSLSSTCTEKVILIPDKDGSLIDKSFFLDVTRKKVRKSPISFFFQKKLDKDQSWIEHVPKLFEKMIEQVLLHTSHVIPHKSRGTKVSYNMTHISGGKNPIYKWSFALVPEK